MNIKFAILITTYFSALQYTMQHKTTETVTQLCSLMIILYFTVCMTHKIGKLFQ